MSSTTYYARRYRTLYSPSALNFAPSAPRQAMAAVYSPAPTGIHCGLPRGVAARGNPRIALALLAPVALVTGLVTFLEGQLNKSAAMPQLNSAPVTLSAEELRRKQLLDAYGDRESLDRLAEVTAIYEATR
ncbi:short-chain alcohol dehydrogenase [Pestalotiopsis sp. IQ-011]